MVLPHSTCHSGSSWSGCVYIYILNIYIYTALNVGRFGHSIHRLSGRDLVVKPMLE